MAKLYEKWLEADNLLRIRAWARDGLTEKQIADCIGINRRTLLRWKNDYEEIKEALNRSKEVYDIQVEESLHEAANGGVRTIKKPMKIRNVEYGENGKKISEKDTIEYAEEEVYIQPNVKAIIYWLNNRLPSKWKNTNNLVIDNKLEEAMESLEELVDEFGEDYANELASYDPSDYEN